MFAKVVQSVDMIAKLIGAFILFWGLLTFIPIVERVTKYTTSNLFGHTGSVFFEVDENGVTWVNNRETSEAYLAGSVVALNEKRRQAAELRWGDTLKVVTTSYLRVAPKGNPEIEGKWADSFHEKFKLRIGDCVVFNRRYTDDFPNSARAEEGFGSDAWLNVSTTSCGIFN